MATTTKAATDLAVGDVLVYAWGAWEKVIGEALTVKTVTDNPFEPDGYVEVLLATPPTPQGATRAWHRLGLDETATVAA